MTDFSVLSVYLREWPFVNLTSLLTKAPSYKEQEVRDSSALPLQLPYLTLLVLSPKRGTKGSHFEYNKA